jgi:hypothetical protein
MRRRLLFVAVFAVSAVAVAGPKWWHGSLTVENRSSYDVHHLYLTPAHKISWGKDWLGDDVLQPHEKITITGLDCADYDIKVIDDDGDACIIEDIDLCQQDLGWEITDKELASCTGWAK